MADEEVNVPGSANALSRFFLDTISKANINKDDDLKKILKKTGFSRRQFQQLLDYLGNFFDLTPKENESWLEFFRRVAITLHQEFPEEGDLITEANVPSNLKELIEEFENHQQLVDQIKAEVKLDILEQYSSPSEVSQLIIKLLEQVQKDIAKVNPNLNPKTEKEIVLARLRRDPKTYQEKLDQARIPSAKQDRLTAELDQEIAKIQLVVEISSQPPEDFRVDIQTLTTLANEILRRQTKSLESAAENVDIKIPPPTAARISALSITALKEEEDKKLQEIERIIDQLTSKPEKKETILNQIASDRAILLQQVPVEEKVRQKLVELQIPEEKAQILARKAIGQKRQIAEEKVNAFLPEVDQKSKTKIIANTLADNFDQVKQTVNQIEGLAKSDQTALVEDLTISNAFIASREKISYEITNLPEEVAGTIPPSFQEKLAQHPQVVEQIAGLVITRASQGVPKQDIPQTIIAPSAISFSAEGITIEEEEKDSLDQIITGLSDTTLKMVALSEEEYYQTSILNQLEKQIGSYFDTFTSLDMTNKINRKAAELIANYWPQKPNLTSQRFLDLKTKEETAFSESLKKLPAGEATEILSQLNSDQNPIIAASVGAQMAETSPDELQEQIIAWQKFAAHLEKVDQADLLIKDKLLSTFQSWYGKGGVAEQVYDSRLYHVYHNFKQIFSPITGFVKSKLRSPIIQLLTQTSIGKGIKILWNRGKRFAQEKIFEPIKKWAFEKIGQKILEKGTEIAVGEGVTAAIATALGVPTAGVSIALWVGWEALKAGYGLIKRGFKALGVDLESASKRFNEMTSILGLAPRINRLIDKIKVLPEIVRDAAKFFSNIFGGIMETAALGALIVPAIVGVFIAIFFMQIFVQGPINLTMAPPVYERGGRGVPGPGGDVDVLDVDVDLSQCEDYSGKVKNACIATVTLQTCFPDGINSSNSGNVRPCLESNTNFSSGTINHMVGQISASARAYTYLQCVGYKRAMEPALPACGDAEDFTTANCSCAHVDLDNIQPGDNAVWTSGTFGHIAMIIDPLPNDPNSVLTAQAWGGAGNVNFKKAVIASIGEIIRCH